MQGRGTAAPRARTHRGGGGAPRPPGAPRAPPPREGHTPRAPAGSLNGVSAFQIQFSARDIRTPGDAPDVLVAMNPAALAANVRDLRPNGMLIVNEDAFTS